MKVLENWGGSPLPLLAEIDTVLTDVDDTLTYKGRLESSTLEALYKLRDSGVRIIPATAASGGWASFMAHSWPVDAVIAENGGLAFFVEKGKVRQELLESRELESLRCEIEDRFPELIPANDQAFRQTSLAYRRPADKTTCQSVLEYLHSLGASGAVNSLWLLAWEDERSKLTAWKELFERPDAINKTLYVGDSENDQPMFEFFPHTVGVSTVTEHRLDHWPRWITKGPGGSGFVEIAERLVAARAVECQSTV